MHLYLRILVFFLAVLVKYSVTVPFLRMVNVVHPQLYEDSKTFVDLQLRVDPAAALAEFAKLGSVDQISEVAARKFIRDHFFPEPGTELEQDTPQDFKPVSKGGLKIHQNITDEKYRALAEAIHKKWNDLGKKVSHHWPSSALLHATFFSS